jgi:hypothetical protein
MRRSLVALLAVLSSALAGQANSGEPIRTSLCELVKKPQHFNGKQIEMRSEFVSRFRWEGFVDETCPAKVQMSAYGIFDDLRAQDGQIHYLPLLRFALESVSDAAATPIAPSVYAENKPRDVTLEEANELVRALFRNRGTSDFALEEYEIKDYPGFQFFQTVGRDLRGHIHYAVDRKTAEVWSGVVCENLTSPSLKKLQNAIRTRIGLTADEFLKIRRRGPRCEE